MIALLRKVPTAFAVLTAQYQCQRCRGWFESDTPFTLCNVCAGT
ncbi:hypothetical protein STBA_71360 [Streptomyces sp. MP131-18]|nr:hypothetical protein STBA_71360 [Streptomyces sp. MP131-18]